MNHAESSDLALIETRSEGFIRTVLDHLPMGLAVNSVQPCVSFRYMNESFPRLYRTTRERLTTPDAFWEAVYEDPAFRAVIRQRILEDCATGDPARMVWRDVPLTRRGEPTTYITARNLPVPGRPLIISMVWDVTESKRAEARLREQLDELQRWHQATLGREVRILDLKRQVNELLAQLGEPLRYASALLSTVGTDRAGHGRFDGPGLAADELEVAGTGI
jgi:PAS domain-containing protein